jgi:hypothetical protein
MEHDIKKISSSDNHTWRSEHTQVDIENKYVTKLGTYLSQWGFKPISKGPGRRGSVMSIKNTEYGMYSKDYFDLTSKDNKVSIEIRQFDDDWFDLAYWTDYSTLDEDVGHYICDQIDAVLYQLSICMKDLPKVNDTKWNDDIKNRKELVRQKEEVIDKIGKKIMSFTDFNTLNDFRKLNNI